MKKEMVITKSIEMELVVVGRKGITNKQMLEAFKSNLPEEELLQLLEDYPKVFKSSIKYTPDAMKIRLEKLVQEHCDKDFTVKTGKKIRNAKEEIVKEQPKVIVLENYKNKNNAKMAKVVERLDILSDEEKAIVKAMVEKDLGITELATQLGLTKDQVYNKTFRSKSSIYNKLAN